MKNLRLYLLPAMLLIGAFSLAHAHATGGAIVGESNLNPTPFANTTYGSGVIDGKAHLRTNAQGTVTKVVVHVEGLIPGTTHVGHIHLGDCTRLFPGTIIHSLVPLVADATGTAVSKTEFADSMAGLRDCEWWVAVHEGATDTDPQSPAIAVGPVLIKGKD